MGSMTTYGQYCPVAKAAEIFADRWTPLIVRELVLGSRHYNAIHRGLPGISRSLLAQRLRRLESTGLVQRRVAGKRRSVEYRLTVAGLELQQVIEALGEWGARWAFTDPRPDEMDPQLLLWWIRRSIHRELLPAGRTVVQFDIRGAKRETAWLVMEPSDVSLCLQHPGFDVDLLVTADIATLYRVWFGWIPISRALEEGGIQLDGPATLVRAFPRWLKFSHFAPVVRAAVEERRGAPAPTHRPRGVAVHSRAPLSSAAPHA